MTGPFQYPTYDQSLGVDSPVARQEWEQFLKDRSELLDSMTNSMSLTAPGASPALSRAAAGNPLVVPSASVIQQNTAPQPGMIGADMNNLIGRAHFWGIANPEGMSPEDLQAEIERRRLAFNPERAKDTGPMQYAEALAGFGLNAANVITDLGGNVVDLMHKITDGMNKLAVSKEYLQSQQNAQVNTNYLRALSQKFSEWEEGMRADLPQNELEGYEWVARGGQAAGYMWPAELAGKVVGAAGSWAGVARLGARISPIVRAGMGAIVSDPERAMLLSNLLEQSLAGAARGLGAGALLESGGGYSSEGLAKRLAMWTGFGAAEPFVGYGLGALAAKYGPMAARLRMSFRSIFDDAEVNNVRNGIPVDQARAPQRPGESEAEWWYDNSGTPLPPSNEGLPPRLIGSGEPVQPPAPPEEAPSFVRPWNTNPSWVRPWPNPPAPGTALDRTGFNFTREWPGIEVDPSGRIVPAEESVLHPEISGFKELENPANRPALPGPQQPKLLGPGEPPRFPWSDTQVKGPDGKPIVVYHGTSSVYDNYDPSFDSGDNLFGKGYYNTEDPSIASTPGYTGAVDLEKAAADFQTQLEINKQAEAQAQKDIDRIKSQGLYQGAPQERVADALQQHQAMLARIQQQRQSILSMMEDLKLRSPNVRPHYLDIRKPYRMDAPAGDGEGLTPENEAILQHIEQNYPNVDVPLIRNTLRMQIGLAQQGVLPGGFTNEHFYETLVSHAIEGPEEYDIIAPQVKDNINGILQDVGYDGITHIGGRGDNIKHRVWIAWKPEQVHSVFSPVLNEGSALQTANAMSKQSAVMESPALGPVMAQPIIEEADAAEALVARDPGQVSIVKGIDDPIRFRDQLNMRGIQHRFAMRDGSYHVLVGDRGAPITDQMAQEYQDLGMFTGQRVTTPGGVDGVVLQPADPNGTAIVAREQGGPPVRVKSRNLLPGRSSGFIRDAESLYQSFRAYALQKGDEAMQQAGMPGVVGMTDPRMGPMLTSYMSDFLDAHGINGQGERAAVEEAFGRYWTNEFKALLPEQAAHTEALVAQADAAADSPEAVDRPVSLQEKAESRGFIWVTAPGRGGMMKDMVSDPGQTDLHFTTDEAAEQFLNNFHRDAPHFTPNADVPAEVADQPMFGPNPGTRLEPSIQGEDLVNLVDETNMQLEDFANALDSGTTDVADAWGVGDLADPPGAGGGGVPPVPPSEALAAGEGPQALPPGESSFGRQVAEFRQTPGGEKTLAQLMRKYDGLIQRIRPQRYRFLSLQTSLDKLGLDLNKSWEYYSDFAHALTRMHNRAAPWHEEWAGIMEQFPRQALRAGDVTRIHEIEDDFQRTQAIDDMIKKYGLSRQQGIDWHEGDRMITDYMHRFFQMLVGDPNISMTAEREIFRYMPHVRQMQDQGIDPYSEEAATHSLNPYVDAFMEHTRTGKIQFRQMDARDLGFYMVRSALFKAECEESWGNMIKAWSDPRIPERLRNIMLDWADVARHGYDPTQDVAVRGVQTLFEKVLGLRLTARETAQIMNKPMGWMYRGQLGGRPDVVFRDAIQPLFAGLKVGQDAIAGVYADILRNPAERAAMWDRGLKGGWVELGIPQMEGLSAFEAPRATPELQDITPEQLARREQLAKVGDIIYDRLPPNLRNPQGGWLDPLKPYTKLGELNRLVSGEAGRRVAAAAIAKYRAAQEAAVMNGTELQYGMDNLLADSKAASFEAPIRQKFQRLVSQGRDEEAANVIANEVANWSQHRYGIKEGPAFARSWLGRLGFQFGNYTPQYLEANISALRNGSTRDRVSFMLGQGAIYAGLAYLTAKTGWNFSKWIWAQSLGFKGGPAVSPTINLYNVVTGYQAAATGNYITPEQRDAMNSFNPSGMAGGLALTLFPYAGAVKTIGNVESAVQANDPEALARTILLGDRGTNAPYKRLFRSMEENMLQNQMSSGVIPSLPMPGQGPPLGSEARGAMPNAQPTAPIGPTAAPGAMPADLGGVNPASVYYKNGHPVFDDSTLVDRQGHMPTNRLDQPTGRLPGESWHDYEARVINTRTWGPDTARISSMNALEPDVQMAGRLLMSAAAQAGVHLEPSETARTQARQEYLFSKNRTTDPVTWTLTSDHTPRRAIDFVSNTPGGYRWLQENAPKFGFTTLGDMDPGHVSMPKPATPGGGAQ